LIISKPRGPEHSSARIERYLQLCADDNMQVVNCTTPAQYFHVLRRQMSRGYRSPLVIFTPKSLLRLARATSRPEELAHGRFSTVVDDGEAAARPEAVERVVFCSGKVYYELMEERLRRHGDAQLPAAIVRVEQLYPWSEDAIASVLRRFSKARTVVWCQEEPANMGAWTFVRERLRRAAEGRALVYAGRPASASPAVGSPRLHKEGQTALVRAAFESKDGSSD
jgi:2-oxoglutarate dehydrogenase E1 component